MMSGASYIEPMIVTLPEANDFVVPIQPQVKAPALTVTDLSVMDINDFTKTNNQANVARTVLTPDDKFILTNLLKETNPHRVTQILRSLNNRYTMSPHYSLTSRNEDGFSNQDYHSKCRSTDLFNDPNPVTIIQPNLGLGINNLDKGSVNKTPIHNIQDYSSANFAPEPKSKDYNIHT
jgi:hypothetical protein